MREGYILVPIFVKAAGYGYQLDTRLPRSVGAVSETRELAYIRHVDPCPSSLMGRFGIDEQVRSDGYALGPTSRSGWSSR